MVTVTRILLLLAVYSLGMVGPIPAFAACKASWLSENANLWKTLRAQGQLIVQKERGTCGAACIVNIAQGALALAQNQTLKNPEADYRFLSTRTTPTDGMNLNTLLASTKEFLKAKIPGAKLRIQGRALTNTFAGEYPDWEFTKRFTHADLQPEETSLLLIAVALFDSSRKYLGCHAQIVEGVSPTHLSLIEPRSPYDNITLKLTGHKRINGNFSPKYRYSTPYQMPRGDVAALLPVAIVKIEFLD